MRPVSLDPALGDVPDEQARAALVAEVLVKLEGGNPTGS